MPLTIAKALSGDGWKQQKKEGDNGGEGKKRPAAAGQGCRQRRHTMAMVGGRRGQWRRKKKRLGAKGHRVTYIKQSIFWSDIFTNFLFWSNIFPIGEFLSGINPILPFFYYLSDAILLFWSSHHKFRLYDPRFVWMLLESSCLPLCDLQMHNCTSQTMTFRTCARQWSQQPPPRLRR